VSISLLGVGNPRVGVIMGSDSDLPTMQAAIDVLVEFGVAYEARVISAHRTPDEMLDYARGTDALCHRWTDEAGECLSMIDTQRYNREIHAQAYHLIAQGGIVIRTQTIFEHS